MKKLTVSLLHLNGWVAVLIGGFILIDPIAVLSPYGLQAEPSTGLMSELRAPGGLLISCGLVIVRSSLNPQLHQQGLQISMLIYGSYGIARLIGMSLDGMPPMEILIATGIELSLLLLSALVLTTLHQHTMRSTANA